MFDDHSTLPVPTSADTGQGRVLTVAQLAEIPERANLACQAENRAHATRLPAGRGTFHAHASHRDNRRAAPGRSQGGDRWERYMREVERAAGSTIRRRLAALSSLYKHLVRHGHAAKNPVTEVERPTINRDEGTTLAFSKVQARKLLELPAEDTVAGLRPRNPVRGIAGWIAPRGDRRAPGRRPAPEPRL
jgi:hypothetical protein